MTLHLYLQKPEATLEDRYTYVAPGSYSLENPWGRVPLGGTLQCRFRELNDALERAFRAALMAAVAETEGLTYFSRGDQSPAIHWEADEHGGYLVGSGLHYEPLKPEDTIIGWLWLQYTSLRPGGMGERPLDIVLPAGYYAHNALCRVDLIIAAAKLHRRSLQARGLLPV